MPIVAVGTLPDDEVGTESPVKAIVFTISRDAGLDNPLEVFYQITGTALNGSDYETLNTTGSVEIPAYSTSATVTVTPIDDTEVEDEESVDLTLIDDPYYDVNPMAEYAVGIILSDDVPPPVVGFGYATGVGAEYPLTSVTFPLIRSTFDPTPLTVFYTISGTATNGVDYVTLSGTATIPGNNNFVDITVTPIDDAEAEAVETVIVTLSEGSDYDVDPNSDFSSREVTITSDDLPAIVIDDDDPSTVFTDAGVHLAEGAQVGDRYALSLPALPSRPSGPTAPVTVTVSSSSPSDFRFAGGARWSPVLTRAILFRPGSNGSDNILNWNDSFILSLTGLEDNIAEGSETHQVIYTLTSADAAYNGLSVPTTPVTVYDSGVTITPVTQNVNEGFGAAYSVVLTAPPGLSLPNPAPEVITITMSAPGSPLGNVPATLTFTRATWNVPQVVFPTTSDDLVINPLPYQGVISHTVSSNITTLDSRYGGGGVNVTAPSVTITINDDEIGPPPLISGPQSPVGQNGGYVAPEAVPVLPETSG